MRVPPCQLRAGCCEEAASPSKPVRQLGPQGLQADPEDILPAAGRGGHCGPPYAARQPGACTARGACHRPHSASALRHAPNATTYTHCRLLQRRTCSLLLWAHGAAATTVACRHRRPPHAPDAGPATSSPSSCGVQAAPSWHRQSRSGRWQGCAGGADLGRARHHVCEPPPPPPASWQHHLLIERVWRHRLRPLPPLLLSSCCPPIAASIAQAGGRPLASVPLQPCAPARSQPRRQPHATTPQPLLLWQAPIAASAFPQAAITTTARAATACTLPTAASAAPPPCPCRRASRPPPPAMPPKVLFCVLPYEGHLRPAAAVAAALQQGGQVDVDFAGLEQSRRTVESFNLKFVSLGGMR